MTLLPLLVTLDGVDGPVFVRQHSEDNFGKLFKFLKVDLGKSKIENLTLGGQTVQLFRFWIFFFVSKKTFAWESFISKKKEIVSFSVQKNFIIEKLLTVRVLP